MSNISQKIGPKKVQVQQATPKPGRVQKALKNGPHSKPLNADGSSHATPSKHSKTSGV